jgi:predicted MFS family arabinose efflux permease
VKRFLQTLVWIVLILAAAFGLSAFSQPYVTRLQAFIGFTVGGLLIVFGVGSYNNGEGPLARAMREHPEDDDEDE